MFQFWYSRSLKTYFQEVVVYRISLPNVVHGLGGPGTFIFICSGICMRKTLQELCPDKRTSNMGARVYVVLETVQARIMIQSLEQEISFRRAPWANAPVCLCDISLPAHVRVVLVSRKVCRRVCASARLRLCVSAPLRGCAAARAVCDDLFIKSASV